VAEAVIKATSHIRGTRNKVEHSPALHPHYIETVKTYNMASGVVIAGADADPLSAPEMLLSLIDTQTMLVVVAYPDFFGRVYDYTALAEAVHAAGALLCVSVNPTALGLLTPPGDFGADIVTGEGQPLGIPLAYGGPYLGLFATRKEYVRKMAGRIVGESMDNRGQRAYVLTLTAREQHIRREKATSNICSNQGLMALATTVYLSALGKHGLKQVAELCYHKAHYAAQQIAAVPGYKVPASTPFFHEFVVECPTPVAEINEHLLEHGILGGYDLGQAYPHIPAMANRMLVAVTEMNTKEDIDLLVAALTEVNHD
jgi:glycine dehydrogenase subunit 1